MNVCGHVVENGLCIGCGLCVAVCPQGRLRIGLDPQGQYQVSGTDSCCPEACDLCLQICPFSDSCENEDILAERLYGAVPGIRRRPATGYFRNSYVGFSPVDGHRQNGSSGGVATWLLESLLQDGEIDRALCVGPVSDLDRLFEYVVCSTPNEIRRCGRSSYYPVEASGVIGYVLKHEGRYAITALPCVAKAIRAAQQKLPALRRRVRFILGLVCGQGKGTSFAEYVCALGGGDPHRLGNVTFRIKDATRPASDFGMRFVCTSTEESRQEGVVFWKEGMGRAWGDRYFTPNACHFCDDVFAECADVALMDAWLSRYDRDPAGHSIVLVRDGTIDKRYLQRAGQTGGLSVTPIGIADVIRSQAGVIQAKRGDLRRRMIWAGEAGMRVPRKRSHLLKGGRCLGRDALIRVQWSIGQQSGAFWAEADKDIRLFGERMRGLNEEVDRARKRLAKFKRINRVIARWQRHWL